MSEKENAPNQLEKKIETELGNFERDLGTVKDINGLEKIRSKYTGKKSFLINTLKNIGSMPDNIRPVAGKNSNTARKKIESDILQKEKFFKGIEYENKLKKEHIDLSLPGKSVRQGKKNIISQVIEEIEEIFIGMGFEIAEGPEVETDYYNFEALNTPADHPARSLHDTFFISENTLLRTHTSPVQIRYMESHKPPLMIISSGKAYRRDYDVSHTPMFTQIEGLVIDRGINFGNLKWTLETFVHEVFGKNREVRFRPHYFPFTEPSAEVDVSCNICSGKGCRVCSGSGWLEILGSGMVDPNLYQYVGYDPEEVSGFAFGMGIERICMLKYGIDDLRLFFESDLRFIEQF
ncbi:MAG TPA: phenylalanine--tRNA ligase subunit alpha [Candidatus Humimicrobiaceae bacterium]|nr:phenylalanine--tRNA ligase subunit alpha [Candidatus Humimicrobiaceae bacterium]